MFTNKDNSEVPIGALLKTKTCGSLVAGAEGTCKPKMGAVGASILKTYGRTVSKPKDRPSTAGLRDRFRKDR